MNPRDEAKVRRKLEGTWCEGQTSIDGGPAVPPRETSGLTEARTPVLDLSTESLAQEGLWEDPTFLER